MEELDFDELWNSREPDINAKPTPHNLTDTKSLWSTYLKKNKDAFFWYDKTSCKIYLYVIGNIKPLLIKDASRKLMWYFDNCPLFESMSDYRVDIKLKRLIVDYLFDNTFNCDQVRKDVDSSRIEISIEHSCYNCIKYTIIEEIIKNDKENR